MEKINKTYLFFFIGIGILQITNAQFSEWSVWSTCLGLPCLTGSQSRTRICEVASCNEPLTQNQECAVMCDAPTHWAQFQYGECVSPEPKCIAGTRERVRNCLNSDTGATVSPGNCPGGFVDASNTIPCNTDLCATFSDAVFNEQCSDICNIGYITGIRSCNQVVSNLPPDCLIVVESCNTQDCEPSQFPAWGRWDEFNLCSSLCSPGTQTRARTCFGENNEILPREDCPGDDYEEIPCNQGYCVTYSQPITVCSGLCEKALLKTTKSCIDVPEGFTPVSCTEQFSTSRCVEDPGLILGPSMDILFLMSTSFNLDDCAAVSSAQQSTSPYLPGTQLYNSAVFPNFFRQVEVVNNFLDTWNQISLTKTRVALDVWGSQCGPRLSTPIIPTYLNDTGLRRLDLDEIPIICSTDSPTVSLLCSVVEIFLASEGDRPDIINTVVLFITDVTNMGQSAQLVLDVYLQIINQSPILNDVTVFMASTLDPTSLPEATWETQQQWLRKYACQTNDDIAECPYFVGSMWQDSGELFQKIRDQVEVENQN